MGLENKKSGEPAANLEANDLWRMAHGSVVLGISVKFRLRGPVQPEIRAAGDMMINFNPGFHPPKMNLCVLGASVVIVFPFRPVPPCSTNKKNLPLVGARLRPIAPQKNLRPSPLECWPPRTLRPQASGLKPFPLFSIIFRLEDRSPCPCPRRRSSPAEASGGTSEFRMGPLCLFPPNNKASVSSVPLWCNLVHPVNPVHSRLYCCASYSRAGVRPGPIIRSRSSAAWPAAFRLPDAALAGASHV